MSPMFRSRQAQSLKVVLLALVLAVAPLSVVNAESSNSIAIIVQKVPGSGDIAADAVRSIGGTVLVDLSIIDGFTAEVPADRLAALEASPGVRFVTPDTPVHLLEDVPTTASAVDGEETVSSTFGDVENALTGVEGILTGVDGFVSSEDTKSVAEVTDGPADEFQTSPEVPESVSEARQPSVDAPSDVSVYKQSIGADVAHAAGALGQGVTVALIDTGVADVADLRDVTVPVTNQLGQTRRCVNLSGERGCGDSYGHGTFIAGLIAGRGDASGGKYQGVAPMAKVLSVKIAGRDGSASVGKILFAIQWVVNNKARYGVKVLNLSLGTDSPQSYKHDPLNYAVERAWDEGITVVVSAGNRGPDARTISKPADDPFVITTGAVDDLKTAQIEDDILPDFSSRGPTSADGLTKPDLTAPGAHLISLRSPYSSIEREFPGGGVDSTYRRGSGTSQSAGVVSGSVALLLSAYPDLTPNQVKFALANTAKRVASDDPNRVGAGMLDVGSAVLRLPIGEANQDITRAEGDGPLRLSQGSVDVVARDGSTVLGRLAGVIPVKGIDSADPSGGSWYGTGWYGGSWYGGSWYGGSWYGVPNGGSWYGGSWYGGSWYGGSWYGGSWYGGSWYGGSWYGAWD